VIVGRVTDDGVPLVELEIGGTSWTAVIDTGFNGDLQLPFALGPSVKARYRGMVSSLLADGHAIEEESYSVELPFDGRLVEAAATFGPDTEILIGTRLMREHRLEVDFLRRTVLIERSLAGL